MYNTLFSTRFLDGEGDASAGGAAPPTPTIKITHEGSEIEVARPAGLLSEKEINEKYVPKASHNDQMARMRKELDAYKAHKSPDDLMQDTEFKAKAVQAWGLDPKATNKEIQEQIQKQKDLLLEREIKPREERLAKAGSTIQSLRLKDLRGQIAQAAAAVKVEDKYLKSPTRNGKPLIVSMLEDTFEFDDEHQEWFAKGTQGNKFAFSSSGDVPYMTVAEFLGNWAGSDGKEFVRSERQAGAEAQAGKEGVSGQVGKELRLTAEQIRDIPFFKKMQARAEKEGLQIIPI